MSHFIPAGKWVRGYLQSDTLATDTAIPLVDADGVSVTLTKNQRFVLEEGLVTNGASAATVTVYSDANASSTYNAGEELLSVNLAANGFAAFPSANGFIYGRTSDGAGKGNVRAVASVNSIGTRINLVGRIIGG